MDVKGIIPMEWIPSKERSNAKNVPESYRPMQEFIDLTKIFEKSRE